MKNKYSDSTLNEAYQSLSKDQQNILDEKVKRGKKTKWLNAWAKKKGIVLTETELSDPDKTMEKLLDWILLDYEDHLTVNKNAKCECGRPLRYRYIVLHKESGRVYKLGKIHFQQHIGLSPDVVRLIMKGLKEIDLERVEILTKVIDEWKLPFEIPKDLDIPKDMVDQINIKLPLLDRQVNRLYSLVIKHINSKKFKETLTELTQPNNKSQLFNRQINMLHSSSIDHSKYRNNIETTKQSKKVEISNNNNSKINSMDLEYDPKLLFDKLRFTNITSDEAKNLYYCIKDNPYIWRNYDLTTENLKFYLNHALGVYGRNNTSIRKWLVEIECLLEKLKYKTRY